MPETWSKEYCRVGVRDFKFKDNFASKVMGKWVVLVAFVFGISLKFLHIFFRVCAFFYAAGEYISKATADATACDLSERQ